MFQKLKCRSIVLDRQCSISVTLSLAKLTVHQALSEIIHSVTLILPKITLLNIASIAIMEDSSSLPFCSLYSYLEHLVYCVESVENDQDTQMIVVQKVQDQDFSCGKLLLSSYMILVNF